MNIHLPDISTVVLTIREHTDRNARLEEFLRQRNYSNVTWHYGNKTRSRHVGARKSAINVLRKIIVPVLWIEDDTTPTRFYQDDICIPEDAQVAYLGGHRWGRGHGVYCAMRKAKHHNLENVKWSDTNHRRSGLYADTNDRDWIRLYSMMGGHAILWIDQSIVTIFHDALQKSSQRAIYDIFICERQWHHRFYGLRHPMFYQNDGHNNQVTMVYCEQ